MLVRYGHFFQFIQAIAGGHASVAIEACEETLEIAAKIEELVRGQRSPFNRREQGKGQDRGHDLPNFQSLPLGRPRQFVSLPQTLHAVQNPGHA